MGVPKWECLSGSAEVGVHGFPRSKGHFGLSSRARFTAARAMSKSGLFGPVKEMSRVAPIISFNPCVAARVRTAMSVRGRRVGAASARAFGDCFVVGAWVGGRTM